MAQANQKSEYLTKDRLNRAASKGVSEASRQAMLVAGSVVTVQGGWLVREYEDGRLEKLKKLPAAPARAKLKEKIKKLASK